MTHQPITRFPASVIAAAQACHKSSGCPASVTLAQWSLESNYGKTMPQNSNNAFGIKSRPGQDFVESPTTEVVHGQTIHITAKFAKYASMAEGFEAHAHLLMNPKGPYGQCLPYVYDPIKYIQRMAHIYATDPKYADKLIKIVADNNLTQYDVKPDPARPTADPAQ